MSSPTFARTRERARGREGSAVVRECSRGLLTLFLRERARAQKHVPYANSVLPSGLGSEVSATVMVTERLFTVDGTCMPAKAVEETSVVSMADDRRESRCNPCGTSPGKLSKGGLRGHN